MTVADDVRRPGDRREVDGLLTSAATGFSRYGNERDAVADEVTRPGAGEDGLLTSSATGFGRYGNERDAVGIW